MTQFNNELYAGFLPEAGDELRGKAGLLSCNDGGRIQSASASDEMRNVGRARSVCDLR